MAQDEGGLVQIFYDVGYCKRLSRASDPQQDLSRVAVESLLSQCLNSFGLVACWLIIAMQNKFVQLSRDVVLVL